MRGGHKCKISEKRGRKKAGGRVIFSDGRKGSYLEYAINYRTTAIIGHCYWKCLA